MSRLETPITRWYCSQVGKSLVEEFTWTPRTKTSQLRLVDGPILPDDERRIARGNEADLTGKRVIVVQTKAANVGMSLLGQTVLSQLLLVYRNFKPSHVDVVALCKGDDDVLHKPALTFRDVEVVVAPDDLLP